MSFEKYSRYDKTLYKRYLYFRKEDVENCKKKDMLEQLLAEMATDYPALGEVFVNERDIYLTYSLQEAASNNRLLLRKSLFMKLNTSP